MNQDPFSDRWAGLSAEAKSRLEQRNYQKAPARQRLGTDGVEAKEILGAEPRGWSEWIPGVEILPRRVFQQRSRGHFAELVRLSEGKLAELGVAPRQWASAMMAPGTAKGFHIHPPHIPAGHKPEDWFQKLYGGPEASASERPYDLEQWDVMFFLVGNVEMLLVEERAGLPRKKMRFLIDGDDMPSENNVAVLIPAGVAHALRVVSGGPVIMVYGTTLVFDPNNEGRIQSGVEAAPLPTDWDDYWQE